MSQEMPPSSPPPTINYGTAAPGGYTGPEPDKNAKTMGMLCHLLALSGFIIPLGSIIGPLVMWLVKKDSHPFVDDQGKEALNFQITVIFAIIASILLMFIVIGFFLLPLVGLCDIIFIIIATIKANSGVAYRYPFAIRLVK